MSTPVRLMHLLAVILLMAGSCDSFNKDALKTPQEVGHLLVSELLSRPDFMIYDTPGVHAVHYAEVCTAFGAVKFAGLTRDSVMMQALTERYLKVEEKIPNTANHVDANVYGILPLEIYMHNQDTTELNLGLFYADGQWSDTLSNGLCAQTRFWIDDIYMIGSLQTQAFRATRNPIYLDRAARELVAYIDSLQQPNGLFFHGPEAPFFWGRGNGWVAAGFAEVLSELPENNPHYHQIADAYKKMMNTLIHFQSDDGMWHQLIDYPDSFAESSSTAMFGFAMASGVKNGLLPREPYTSAYTHAWNALTGYMEGDGKIREICVGTGQSKEADYYLNRPRITGDLHGQAPMLWFANELLEP